VNGPGSETRDNYYFMFEKNSPDRPWLMCYFLRVDALLDLKDVSGRIDNSICIMILLISNDMIVVETVCLWKIVVCYCGECDPLVVTVCHWLVAVCY
jgi:hypothetical protein